MFKTLCLILLLSGSTTILAQEIYKWTDANGKVHFGDKVNAPPGSEPMAIRQSAPVVRDSKARENATGGQARPDASLRIPMGEVKLILPEKTAENEKVLSLGTDVLSQCMTLARGMSNANNRDEEKSFRMKYLSLCPGVLIDCVSYKTHPEDNRCTPLPRKADGSIVAHKVYER